MLSGSRTDLSWQHRRFNFRSMPIQFYPTLALQEGAFEMALETERSIYDCIYLALAELLEGRMVTADCKFFQALDGGCLSSLVLWIEYL